MHATTQPPKIATLTKPTTRITLDHLWIITVLALIWLFISVLPLPPNDLWWHMAAGRTMVAEGQIIHTNRWAYTLPFEASYIYQSWLSELLMYALWWIGAVPALTLARTLVIVLSYGLVSWHAWRRAGNGKAVAAALFLAVLIGWNNWTLRPQTLALLPGAAFLVVLGEYLGGRISARWLWALPACMILWVNMHGSFALGVGLIVLAVIGITISAIRAAPVARGDAWRRVRACALACCGTCLAVLINPLGIGITGYVDGMLGNTTLQQSFVEWQPPRIALNLADTGLWFFAMLLLLAVLMASTPRRPTATDLLWYSALAWLTIGGVRYAMWFALFLLPLLAEQIAALSSRHVPVRSGRTFNTAYAIIMATAIIAVLPWFEPGRYLGSDAEHFFADAGPYHMLLGNTTPLIASEWLAQHPQQGRFWTNMNYSSYTIWQLPDVPVFSDLRVELFPAAIWTDYFNIARGDQRSVELLNSWHIAYVLLDQNGEKALYQTLRKTAGWCERFRDEQSVILARCS